MDMTLEVQFCRSNDGSRAVTPVWPVLLFQSFAVRASLSISPGGPQSCRPGADGRESPPVRDGRFGARGVSLVGTGSSAHSVPPQTPPAKYSSSVPAALTTPGWSTTTERGQKKCFTI